MGTGVLVACGPGSFMIQGARGVSTYTWDKSK